MATRRIPVPKIEGSIPSVIMFFLFLVCSADQTNMMLQITDRHTSIGIEKTVHESIHKYEWMDGLVVSAKGVIPATTNGFDHINRNPPVLIRTPKLTRFEPAQYWGGGPPGNSVVLNPFLF